MLASDSLPTLALGAGEIFRPASKPSPVDRGLSSARESHGEALAFNRVSFLVRGLPYSGSVSKPARLSCRLLGTGFDRKFPGIGVYPSSLTNLAKNSGDTGGSWEENGFKLSVGAFRLLGKPDRELDRSTDSALVV